MISRDFQEFFAELIIFITQMLSLRDGAAETVSICFSCAEFLYFHQQMTTEISLEETNKIRKSLGLAPIQDDSASLKPKFSDDAESISLEETNKIRAQLGLKLIPTSSQQAAAKEPDSENSNWKEFKIEEHKVVEHEKLQRKLRQLKEEAQRRKQLEGGTILDGIETEDSSSKNWLSRFKKMRQKAVARRLEQEEDESLKDSNDEAEESSLSGMKVAHKLSDIQNIKEDVILTLKDQSVLDEDQEELVSSKLEEKEKLEEKKEALKGKSKYHDDHDEILDVTEEKESDHFLLSGKTIKNNVSKPGNEDVDMQDEPVGVHLNLDDSNFTDPTVRSDYQEPKKFKKFKKKTFTISEKKRKRLSDDDGIASEDADLDLQSALTKNRKRILKSKRSMPSAEEIAESLLASTADAQTAEKESDGVVVSQSTDFLSYIRKVQVEEQSKELTPETENLVSEDTVIKIEDDHPSSSFPETKPSASEVEKAGEPDETLAERDEIEDTATISVGGSMAETLRLLKAKGVIKQSEEEEKQTAQMSKQREWQKELERRRIKLEADFQKRRDKARQEAGYDRLGAKQKAELVALEKQQFEAELGKVSQDMFADYRPVVNIEYHDESGAVLSTKEAYKHLSHQFHGNASGKKRVEKQLKKREEQLKQESKTIFNNDDRASSSKKQKPGIRLQ